MSGSDKIMTAHAYTLTSMPACASLTRKSAAISTSKPTGMNSDVLKMNVETAMPISGSHAFAVIGSLLSMPFAMRIHSYAQGAHPQAPAPAAARKAEQARQPMQRPNPQHVRPPQ